MKSKLLLSMVLLLAIISSAFSSPVHTALNVRMYDGRPISIIVDGIPQGQVASQHEVLNLAPGMHRLKVLVAQRRPYGWNQVTMVPVFRGNVEVFHDYAVYTSVDRFGGLVIEDYEALLTCEPVPPVCGVDPNPGHGHYPDNQPQYPGNNGNWNNNNNHGGGNWNNNSNNGGGWNHGGNQRVVMNQNDFGQLLSVIQTKSFDSTKQQVALGAINNNYFTSDQVRQMLNLFTFESTKMDVAKKAYDKVVDQDRFYVVYDSFTFESSITDLVSLSR